MKYEMAEKAKNDELNTRVNKSWRNKRTDGKKLWECIDWRGKAELKRDKQADESEIRRHPIINDILCVIDTYGTYIQILDDIPKMKELDKAMQLIGTCISIDGIPPNVARILPHTMKEVILDLVKSVFPGIS